MDTEFCFYCDGELDEYAVEIVFGGKDRAIHGDCLSRLDEDERDEAMERNAELAAEMRGER